MSGASKRAVAHVLPAPTHTCFDDTLDFVAAYVDAGRGTLRELEASLWIMHGLCRPRGGALIAHGWLHIVCSGEIMQGGRMTNGDRCFYRLPGETFNTIWQPQLVTRYRVSEALEQNRRHLTFGPWVPEYIERCGFGHCSICGETWPDPLDPELSAAHKHCVRQHAGL
jgi:hypothetical protein